VFAERMVVEGWIKQFTRRATPGAYLRVVEPGTVRPGDPVTLVYRSGHEVTVALFFRAFTTEPHLLPDLLAAGDALPVETRETVLRRTAALDAPDGEAAPAP
jgi:MOSC domain-containing protein YiiM